MKTLFKICAFASVILTAGCLNPSLNDLTDEQNIIDRDLPVGTPKSTIDQYLDTKGYYQIQIEYRDEEHCWTKIFSAISSTQVRDICFDDDANENLTEIIVYQYEAYD